jgi:hypothetical protein
VAAEEGAAGATVRLGATALMPPPAEAPCALNTARSEMPSCVSALAEKRAAARCPPASIGLAAVKVASAPVPLSEPSLEAGWPGMVTAGGAVDEGIAARSGFSPGKLSTLELAPADAPGRTTLTAAVRLRSRKKARSARSSKRPPPAPAPMSMVEEEEGAPSALAGSPSGGGACVALLGEPPPPPGVAGRMEGGDAMPPPAPVAVSCAEKVPCGAEEGTACEEPEAAAGLA